MKIALNILLWRRFEYLSGMGRRQVRGCFLRENVYSFVFAAKVTT